MKVQDYMNVYERGWVLICDKGEIHVGDKISAKGNTFEVTGTETATGINWIGLVLYPNNIVPDCFEIGDEVRIIKNE